MLNFDIIALDAKSVQSVLFYLPIFPLFLPASPTFSAKIITFVNKPNYNTYVPFKI